MGSLDRTIDLQVQQRSTIEIDRIMNRLVLNIVDVEHLDDQTQSILRREVGLTLISERDDVPSDTETENRSSVGTRAKRWSSVAASFSPWLRPMVHVVHRC